MFINIIYYIYLYIIIYIYINKPPKQGVSRTDTPEARHHGCNRWLLASSASEWFVLNLCFIYLYG